MLKLRGYGLGPSFEFELDPSTGRYLKRRTNSDALRRSGYSGIGQELWVPGRGVVLCSVYAHDGAAFLRMRDEAWNLFQPGLRITHIDGVWRSRLTVFEPGGRQIDFGYKRKDLFLMLIDSTYDQLDSELANLPANLPSLAEHDEAELLAWLCAPRASI